MIAILMTLAKSIIFCLLHKVFSDPLHYQKHRSRAEVLSVDIPTKLLG